MVSVEFLIAFPSLWVFSLCILQLVLVARADLMVRHASECAARSAAVVLPDDPARYEGEPQMSVTRDSRGWTEGVPDETSSEVQVVADAILGRRGSRRDTIANAAETPRRSLAPLTTRSSLRAHSVRSSLGPEDTRAALRRDLDGLTIEFLGAEADRVTGTEVTVVVGYAYRCEVPIARHIVCEGNSKLRGHRSRVWRIEHSATALIHDAPYSYTTERAS